MKNLTIIFFLFLIIGCNTNENNVFSRSSENKKEAVSQNKHKTDTPKKVVSDKYGKDMVRLAGRNKIKEIDELVKNGVPIDSIDEEGVTALMRAAADGHLELVKWLVANGASVNKMNIDDIDALNAAAAWLRWDVLRYLMTVNQVDLKTINFRNAMLLYDAAQDRSGKMTEWLLSQGIPAKKLCIYYEGLSPIYQAAYWGNAKGVKLMIDAGMPFDEYDSTGNTPLICATQEGHIEVAKILLHAGANINATDSIQITPLMLAAEVGHPDILKLLIDNGADIERKNKSGNTALEVARISGNKKCIELLEAASK